MPRDELRQPLRRRGRAERLWAKRPSPLLLASVVAAFGFAGGGYWLSRIPYPFAGEPVLTLALPPVSELKTASLEAAPEPAAPPVEEADASPDNIAVEDAGGQQTTISFAGRRPLKAAPFAQVSEAGDDGPLPRVSASGRKPSELYAQITPMSVTTSDRPKIAILLGGMGLNARLTRKAIKDLPGDISFGFAPYGNDLQEQVNRARAGGHEIMLQLPMEPNGYPANNPGSNTLLAEAGPEENLKALRWHMSRFAGYTGITNYMGSRFLATPSSLAPVLKELKARGLVFLEDASISQSSVAEVAKISGLATRRAAVTIDADPEPAEIQAALARLEAEAAASGFAVGTGSGLEVTIDTLTEWAKQLESRGILLVPVSAVYKGRVG